MTPRAVVRCEPDRLRRQRYPRRTDVDVRDVARRRRAEHDRLAVRHETRVDDRTANRTSWSRTPPARPCERPTPWRRRPARNAAGDASAEGRRPPGRRHQPAPCCRSARRSWLQRPLTCPTASRARTRRRAPTGSARSVLLEAVPDDAIERRRQRRRARGELRRILVENRRHRVGRASRAGTRARPLEHLVEHGAEREEVGALRPTAWPRTCSGAM